MVHITLGNKLGVLASIKGISITGPYYMATANQSAGAH